MNEFGELKKVPLRGIWSHEAHDFTPWLAENIEALGVALGLELELTGREASVGGFSADLLAKDLNSSRTVVIENQLSQTDHDHLGKLPTYAAGFDASIVIWIFEEIRDEHRQALEWLNERTNTETHFFGVEVEILKIDDSKPAVNFKPIVFPNEWQKSKRQQISTNISPKDEKYQSYFQFHYPTLAIESVVVSSKDEGYQSYFQGLICYLEAKGILTGGHAGRSKNRYSFPSRISNPGIPKISYRVAFPKVGKVSKASASIYIEGEDKNLLFDALGSRKAEITSKFGGQLEWECLDERKHATISVYRDGGIGSSDSELEEIREWHIENLLKLKEVFTPEIERALEEIGLTSVPQ